MTHKLTTHVEAIRKVLAGPETAPTLADALRPLLLAFQRDAYECMPPGYKASPADRADAANRFRINLNSVWRYQMDLFSDLRVFWLDPHTSDFTAEQLAELAQELVRKYAAAAPDRHTAWLHTLRTKLGAPGDAEARIVDVTLFLRTVQDAANSQHTPPVHPDLPRIVDGLRKQRGGLQMDLRFFSIEAGIAHFDVAQMPAVAQVLVRKYPPPDDAPEITAVHTAEEAQNMSRIRATVREADDVLAAAQADLDRAISAKGAAELSRAILKRALDDAERDYREAGAANAKRRC